MPWGADHKVRVPSIRALIYTFSPFTTFDKSAKMKYIHSEETLTIPEGGKYGVSYFWIVENGGRED
ncbi:hypothetical protein BofuT4_uP090620.1 [Botrytis cinerea T4]|uniref:Uncharacterized protein n=1 Tax=Botryotinia fuckeliana (strain T4) TaxID=999810 RepID=G2YEY2_BOTF4|nr:hypothetical protein BofuT4_uP090620.1 [Botrytis cinerea T4]